MGIVKSSVLALSLFATAAVAQNRYCIGGSLDHMNAGQRAVCQARLGQLRTALDQDSSVNGWHVVLVCDEAGWSDYTAFSARPQAEIAAAAIDVNADLRTIYLRASKVDSSDAISAAVRTELNNAPAAGQESAVEQIASR